MNRTRLRVGVAVSLALVAATGVSVSSAGERHAAGSASAGRDTAPVSPDVLGVDVSAYQHGVDWRKARADGAQFAFVKATEGSNYTNARLASQYAGAERAGILRAAYHFAQPNTSSGVVQAEYFVHSLSSLGGGRVDASTTLPPILDIEYDPYTKSDGTNSCWGLTPKRMRQWISQFSDTVITMTGRVPAIYTTADWWSRCTGDSADFPQNPLYIARYVTSRAVGETAGAKPLPAGWSAYTFWQYTNAGTRFGDIADTTHGSVPARDEDVFAGGLPELRKLARSTFTRAVGLIPDRARLP
jgi:GH25 family lysozyme M1 (1,4-beta-N-acetylmuramidase)